MIVQRCDNCKKPIEGLDNCKLGRSYSGIDLCEACAEPIYRLVIEKELLRPKVVRQLKAELAKNS